MGLAVGDIAKVRSSASLARVKLDLEVITDLQDYRFPMWIRKRLYRPSLVVQIDKKSGYLKRVNITTKYRFHALPLYFKGLVVLHIKIKVV